MSRSASAGVRGGSVYLGTDILGIVRSATGEAGTLEGRYEYDAFGRPYKGNLENGMNLGYTGKPYDSRTGLYNYGYRDYEPGTARFTTVDPVRDGSNWFAYVNNDPVNWVDLWGLDPVNTYSLRRVLSSQDPRNTKKTTYENRYYSTDDQAIGELRNIHYLQIKNRQMDQTTQITEIVKIDSSELSPEIANRLGPGIIVHERINNGVQENISTLHRESPGKFSLCSK